MCSEIEGFYKNFMKCHNNLLEKAPELIGFEQFNNISTPQFFKDGSFVLQCSVLH